MTMRLRHLLTIGGCLALVLLCGTGTLVVWSDAGHDMVLPGAERVRIDRRGAQSVHITYVLPPNQVLRDLRRHLGQQGWVQVKPRSFDRVVMRYERTTAFGLVLDIATVAVRPGQRRLAEISVARCFQLQRRVICP
jgi:hypothetical protein